MPGLSEVAKTSWLIAALVAHNLVYPVAATGILGTVAF